MNHVASMVQAGNAAKYCDANSFAVRLWSQTQPQRTVNLMLLRLALRTQPRSGNHRGLRSFKPRLGEFNAEILWLPYSTV